MKGTAACRHSFIKGALKEMIARIALCFVLCPVVLLTADQIPPFFLDSVVALGRSETPVVGQPLIWKTEASGFLYGWPADKETDPTKHAYEVSLVTNRHVIANHTAITVRLNPEKTTETVQEFPLALKNPDGTDLWVSHPDTSIDISVIKINARYLRDRGLKIAFFQADNHAADKAKLKDIGLSVGEDFCSGLSYGSLWYDPAELRYCPARRYRPN
jgi:hypothetical protein